MAFEKKYKFLVTVPQEKVAAAEETFVRYGGQAYLKRRTTATSPEFVMNVVRMNIPWRRLRGRVNVHLEEPENEVTLVYIVNDSQMTGLKEEKSQPQLHPCQLGLEAVTAILPTTTNSIVLQ